MKRILTAAVLLGVLWPLVELGPEWSFPALVAVVVSLGAWEAYRLMSAIGSRPLRPIGILACLGLVWSAFSESGNFELVMPLIAATVITPIVAMWTRPSTAEIVHDTVSTLFPVLFIGLTLSYLVRIWELPAGEDGRDLLYLLFVCVIFADTAAFYVGTAIGKRRIAPSISPKKSWEGTIAGMLAAVGGGLLGHFWFYQRLALMDAIIVGLMVGLAAVLGDLAESALKRTAQAKDSSGLLPGHGGVLDRTDSLLFSGPLLYYYYTTFLG